SGTRPTATGNSRGLSCIRATIASEARMSASLDVRDLRRQFAIGRPAVDGVSFHVPAGEIVVLLGPSGCGKTTTLRCIAGLEHASAGRISIGGRLVSAPDRRVMVPPRLREIGMVFQ